jgi:hypothetical protein
MRITGTVLAFVLILRASSQPSAQQTSGTSVQRDSQAVAILNQVLSGSGGASAVGTLQDFTESGKITYSWAGSDVTAPLSITAKGLDKFRMDAVLPEGNVSYIIHGLSGVSIFSNGVRTPAPSYNLFTIGSLTVPQIRVLGVLNDSSTSLKFIGLVYWNGMDLYQIHVVLSLNSYPSFTEMAGLGSFDLYVSPETNLVMGISETFRSSNNFSDTYTHEIHFSNYASVAGTAIPFQIEENLSGQKIWTINIAAATFNTGVSDSVFDINQ